MSDAFTELKSYLDRIMRLHEERKGLSDDIGEIYKEAKGRGFDRKAMVATVRRLLGDETAFAELDATVDLYLRAYRGTGMEHADAHVPAPAQAATPHNPDTGEIEEQAGESPAQESCGSVDGHAVKPIALEDRTGTATGVGGEASQHTLNSQPMPSAEESSVCLGATRPTTVGEANTSPSAGDGVGIEPGPQDTTPKPLPIQVHKTIGGQPLKPAIDYSDVDAVTRQRQADTPDIPAFLKRANTGQAGRA